MSDGHQEAAVDIEAIQNVGNDGQVVLFHGNRDWVADAQSIFGQPLPPGADIFARRPCAQHVVLAPGVGDHFVSAAAKHLHHPLVRQETEKDAFLKI